MRWVGLVVLVVGVAACGDDASPATADAGVADAAADGAAGTVGNVAPPVAPALPVMTPCPAGWREVVVAGDPATCEPWPEAGRATCDVGEMHLPGAPGCEPVGTACAADGWPTGLPAGATVRYVRAGAAAGGDGTLALPFDRVSAALTGAARGTIIAIAPGTYDATISVPAGITLWGACPTGTILTSTSPSMWIGAVQIAGPDVVVRNLRIGTGGARPAVSATVGSANARFVDVVVHDSERGGVLASGGASLTFEHCSIRDIRPTATGDNGFGMLLHDMTLDMSRTAVEHTFDSGITIEDARAVATLTDVVVRDTAPMLSDVRYGRTVNVEDGASLTLTRVVIEQGSDLGLRNFGATLVAEDLIVRDIRGLADGTIGSGIVVTAGGTAMLTRVLVERVRDAAIYDFASITMSDVVVRDAIRDRPRPFGSGIGVAGADATLTADRVFVARVGHSGIDVEIATCDMRDVTVRNVRSIAGDTFGRGLSLFAGARGTVTRVAIEQTLDEAIVVEGAGTEATLEDVSVADMAGNDDGLFGAGVVVITGAQLTLRRARIARTRAIGVAAEDTDTVLRAEDLEVSDVLGEVASGRYGRAVNVQGGASVELTRARLLRVREAGMFTSRDARIVATDLLVDGIAERACATTTCPGARSGIGAIVTTGGTMELTRFELARGALAGLMVAGGAIDLHDGVIRECEIGANVQDTGFDLARISDRVVYIDNERQLDASMLPVPDVLSAL